MNNDCNMIDKASVDTPIDYPAKQVLILFSLVGTVIGGIILTMIMLLIDISFGYQMVIFSLLIGILPATLTAVYMCYQQIYAEDIFNSPVVFFAGAVSSIIFAMSVIVLINIIIRENFMEFLVWSNLVASLIIMIFVGILGGICAIFAGLCTLPKQTSLPKNRSQ